MKENKNMKLGKNQRGSAHFVAVFAVLFAVIGFVGLAVSQAATKPRGSNGGIKGTARIVICEKSKAEENCKHPYASIKGTLSRHFPPIDCSDRTKPCPSAPRLPAIPFTTDEKGKFKLEVPQGEYRVSLSQDPKAGISCDSPIITVKIRKYADVKITCSQAFATEPQASGIDGTVVSLYAPACPENMACAQVLLEKPYANASGYIGRSAKPGEVVTQEVYEFTTDAEGRFNVPVSAGKYLVTIEPNDSQSPTCPKQTVEVFDQRVTSTKITCEPANNRG